MQNCNSLIRPFNLTGINENCIVAFKPINNIEWYTGRIKYIFEPNSKYNEHDYWAFEIIVILPINPQWSEDNDKTIYYDTEVEKIIVLDNSK